MGSEGNEPTSTGRPWRLLARALFYVALPLALVTTNVRFAFNEERVYQYSIDHYDVTSVTNIPRADLIAATQDIRAYFNNGEDYLRTRVHDSTGSVVPLFNSREVLHMHDVKTLVRLVYALQAIAVGAVAAYIVGVVLWAREESLATLARQALKAAAATVLLLFAFAALAATDGFEPLFIWFHQRAFGNDYWQLDPLRDHLVQMFPEGFWLDATLLIGVLTVLEAAIVGGCAALYLLKQERQRHHDGEAALAQAAADEGQTPLAVGGPGR